MTRQALQAGNDNSAAEATATPFVEHFNESASKQIEGSSMAIIAEPPILAKPEPGHTARTVPATARPVPSIEHIITAPLHQLLTEQNAQLFDLDIPMDPNYFGCLVRTHDGRIILAMPSGRDPIEREATVRMLIADFHDLGSDDFPTCMTATTVVENGEYVL